MSCHTYSSFLHFRTFLELTWRNSRNLLTKSRMKTFDPKEWLRLEWMEMVTESSKVMELSSFLAHDQLFSTEIHLYASYSFPFFPIFSLPRILSSPLAKFEEEKTAHEAKMAKMESEMKAVFQQKVAEKETKLKQSEEEVKQNFVEKAC